jgi:hypothetical protein
MNDIHGILERMTRPILPRSYQGAAGFPVWTIYWIVPPGAPGVFVVRRREVHRDGIIGDPLPAYVGDSLAEARNVVPFEANHCIHRAPDDHPTIIESWV